MESVHSVMLKFSLLSIFFFAVETGLACSDPQAARPESFGVIGAGDDTPAIQRAIGSGKKVCLSARTYVVNTPIILENNTTIYSETDAYIEVGPNFNNTDPQRALSPGANVLWAYDKSNIRLSKFRIIKKWNSQHVVQAILIRKGSNISIDHLKMTGFSKAAGVIRLDSINMGRIHDNVIHDCQTADGYQLTGLSIDGDRASDSSGAPINSYNFVIQRNQFSRLLVSAKMASENKYETDGINVAGPASEIWIIENSFFHVGEGVDVFSNLTRVDSNYIYEPFSAGIKIVHGASQNRASQNEILRPGLWGIVIAGSNTMTRHTQDNTVAYNKIVDAGRHPTAQWLNHTRSAIALVKNGTLGYPVRNLVYSNSILGIENLHFGIFCEVGPNNIFNNEVQGRALIEGFRQCP